MRLCIQSGAYVRKEGNSLSLTTKMKTYFVEETLIERMWMLLPDKLLKIIPANQKEMASDYTDTVLAVGQMVISRIGGWMMIEW